MVEFLVVGFSINIGIDCLFDIENFIFFYSVVLLFGVYVFIVLKEKIWNNDYIVFNKLLMKEFVLDIQYYIVYYDGVIQVKLKYKDEIIVFIL